MAFYYVNNNMQPNWDHEVHTDSCPYFPLIVDKTYLGNFTTCGPAVMAAKRIHPQSNGCWTCSPACHTG